MDIQAVWTYEIRDMELAFKLFGRVRSEDLL